MCTRDQDTVKEIGRTKLQRQRKEKEGRREKSEMWAERREVRL